MEKRKNPHAVELGRLGCGKASQKQIEAVNKNLELAREKLASGPNCPLCGRPMHKRTGYLLALL